MAAEKETIINGLYTNPVFSQLMRRNLDPQSVWYGLVNFKWEKELKKHGDRVTIYQPGNIPVRDYVKGQDMSFDSPDGNKIEVVLDQQKYFGFQLEDIDVKQSDIKGLGEIHIDRAQTAITLVKDTFISTKIWDGIHADNMITDASTLTKDTVYGLLTQLMGKLRWTSAVKSNGTGYDGKRPWLVVDPDVFGIILQAPETGKATVEGDKTTREGTVLKLAGFDIKVSNHSANGGARKIIAGTTEGFAFVNQIQKTKVQQAEKRFATNYSGLYLFGGDVVQEKALAGAEVTLG